MKAEIIMLAVIVTMPHPSKSRALELDLKDIARKGTEAISSIKDRVVEVDWQGLHQKGVDAINQAGSQVAEANWQGLHQKGVDAVNQAGAQIVDVDWQSLLDRCRDVLDEAKSQLSQVEWETILKKLLEILEHIKGQVILVEWSKLPSELQDWIKEHPADAAFYLVGGVVFFYPSVVSGPLLGLLGFASKGPIAGSPATLAQAMIGEVPARHIFSYLQSAAMGGYGAFPVETAVRGVAAAAIAIKFLSDMGTADREAYLEGDPERDHGMGKAEDFVLLRVD
ncbi:hypothetical protein FGG08_003090 [Glutinoglossum americanum]|uniref:Uncharacterized protein n=1 Tax=Glutinoglossum americanum TaxID=1670608 RepID=A0A9P8L3W7_9PEZI|nr:hypothetical protein FGG08_003090 [Glutinoglossum americanum]